MGTLRQTLSKHLETAFLVSTSASAVCLFPSLLLTFFELFLNALKQNSVKILDTAELSQCIYKVVLKMSL